MERFQTFVANRIATIKEASDIDQWRCIPTTQNPADDASMGLKFEHLAQRRWIESPKFLWNPKNDWPADFLDTDITDDPEVKRNVIVSALPLKMFQVLHKN